MIQIQPSCFPQNYLLAALPAHVCARLSPDLELVYLPLGHMLYEPGMQMCHVYLPTTAIASLSYIMEDGASAQTAMVGPEGIVGFSLFMGGETTSSQAAVQSAGHAYRLQKQVLEEEFNRSGELQHLLLRYTQALLTQMAQTAVCNRHHSLDQQFCRWLLQSLDRLPTVKMFMTQELISNALGVRREGITEAAGNLHRAGLIEYRRGHITILDRAELEKRVCECYAVAKKEFNRLLPGVTPRTSHPLKDADLIPNPAYGTQRAKRHYNEAPLPR
ncbi:MAG: Crp/Fnr family transcriptional regulator [Betaproteobacteria bacterium]|nr:Crp/Fnr family transcriptional regulator [Betaproteobacteria bacterium]